MQGMTKRWRLRIDRPNLRKPLANDRVINEVKHAAVLDE
jgi:hypothetical protein